MKTETFEETSVSELDEEYFLLLDKSGNTLSKSQGMFTEGLIFKFSHLSEACVPCRVKRISTDRQYELAWHPVMHPQDTLKVTLQMIVEVGV